MLCSVVLKGRKEREKREEGGKDGRWHGSERRRKGGEKRIAGGEGGEEREGKEEGGDLDHADLLI